MVKILNKMTKGVKDSVTSAEDGSIIWLITSIVNGVRSLFKFINQLIDDRRARKQKELE